MKTLFFTSLTVFAAFAVAWFFVWAIWVHAPKGWFGRGYSPLAPPIFSDNVVPAIQRQRVWYHRLKLATFFFLALSIVTGAAFFLLEPAR